jgi:hypothetical protein
MSGPSGEAWCEYPCGPGYYRDQYDSCSPCPRGKYKDTYEDRPSCTACPAFGNVAGTTAKTGSTAITDCYIPKGGSFSDAGGTYTFSGDCKYTK